MNIFKKYITCKKNDRYLYIKLLVKEFNLFEKRFLINKVRTSIEKHNYPDVIFDLSDLMHLDSIGIGFLISTKNIFNDRNREMLIVITSKKILDMFTSLNVGKFLNVFHSAEEAEEWLRSPKNQ